MNCQPVLVGCLGMSEVIFEVVTFDLFFKGSFTIPEGLRKDKKIYISAK